MTSTIRSSLLFAFLALAACTTVQYRPVALPLIARPVLPHVESSALQCLAPQTYIDLANRERQYKSWGMQYEAEVEANNAKAKGK